MSRYFTLTKGQETNSVLQSNAFAPQKEFVYAEEYTTCKGEVRADYLGWRYAQMTLSWDTLPEDQLLILYGLSGEFDFTFTDPAGSSITETVIPVSQVQAATRYLRNDGTAVWKDVQLEVRFVDVHN